MNIVLIGMPGAGKSTIGVLLAKALAMDFIDTDILIQNKTRKSLQNIIIDEGIESFLKTEGNVLEELKCDNCVIATGGSAVYSDAAMINLRKNAQVIYLKLPVDELKKRLSNIKTRGVVMKPGSTIETIYNDRTPLYEKYKDYSVDCANKSIEQCVNEIVKLV